MEYKGIPIGVDSFTDMRENDYYYVDKTLFIKELLDLKGKVTLFTRPRRFGKTLNMTMLRDFFQLPADEGAAERQRKLFEGLKIMEAGEAYTSRMGGHPVIFLSLKSVEGQNWETAYKALCNEIELEFGRHARFFSKNVFPEQDRVEFEHIFKRKREPSIYRQGLRLLSRCLEKIYGEKVVMLIDEYDVPLEKAYFYGYYEEMIGFIRTLFESALKTNEALEFGVLTGCLRISRESIFTGLNNLAIVSIDSEKYAEHFGFTPKEVEKLLHDFGLSNRLDNIKEWYDGYLFGDTEVYNPWSVLNFVWEASGGDNVLPKPYWANTSGNAIVRTLIQQADESTKGEIETLMEGETIEKPIHEDITYDEVEKSMDHIWNFLYFTGYLTKVKEWQDEDGVIFASLRIPNKEVGMVYRNHIEGWFHEAVENADLRGLYEAILSRDGASMEREINHMLRISISYMDSGEAFYHGFMIGILAPIMKGSSEYIVKSNRESGNGRYDILLARQDYTKAIVFELKTAARKAEMEGSCAIALAQIKENQYDRALLEDGYDEVIPCGISFWRKLCRVEFGN